MQPSQLPHTGDRSDEPGTAAGLILSITARRGSEASVSVSFRPDLQRIAAWSASKSRSSSARMSPIVVASAGMAFKTLPASATVRFNFTAFEERRDGRLFLGAFGGVPCSSGAGVARRCGTGVGAHLEQQHCRAEALHVSIERSG